MTTTLDTSVKPAVTAQNLSKTYGTGEATVHALNNVTVSFEQGKFTAIMGPSGSGKSTLMQTLAILDTPDVNPKTSIKIADTELYGRRDKELTEFRREHIGFIFQAFNLVPTLTAGQNIDLPLGLAGKKPDPIWRDYLVETLGLTKRLSHRPEQLSGGQQQRVAIVRALLSRPGRRLRRRAHRQPRFKLWHRSTQAPANRSKRASANHPHGDPRCTRSILRRPRSLPQRRCHSWRNAQTYPRCCSKRHGTVGR